MGIACVCVWKFLSFVGGSANESLSKRVSLELCYFVLFYFIFIVEGEELWK